MEWWEAFWLGLTQGITEFIKFWCVVGSRDLLSQTYLANLKDVFVKHDLGLAANIVITCIPAVILGVLLNDLIQF